MSDEQEPIHLNTEEARAGATPHMTRYILGFSLVLVVVILAIVVIARS